MKSNINEWKAIISIITIAVIVLTISFIPNFHLKMNLYIVVVIIAIIAEDIKHR